MERGIRSPRLHLLWPSLASTNGTKRRWLVSGVESDSSKERLRMSLRLNRLAVCASAHIGKALRGMTDELTLCVSICLLVHGRTLPPNLAFRRLSPDLASVRARIPPIIGSRRHEHRTIGQTR